MNWIPILNLVGRNLGGRWKRFREEEEEENYAYAKNGIRFNVYLRNRCHIRFVLTRKK